MIVLLTDFGLSDPYVGQMKGALISRAPDCHIVDLTHEVPPFGLTQAGFFLQASYKFFGEGSIFLAVVDPGVGSRRRIVGLEAEGHLFLAPDNGLLSLLLEHSTDVRAYHFNNPLQMCVSATFHGRDVFAPLAAQVFAGDSPESLGREIDPSELVRLGWSAPVRNGAKIQAHALHVDHFGNVITNFMISEWSNDLIGPMEISTGIARLPLRRVGAYCDLEHGEVGFIAGSQGFFEIAMNMGNAADLLSLRPAEGLTLHIL